METKFKLTIKEGIEEDGGNVRLWKEKRRKGKGRTREEKIIFKNEINGDS